MDDLWNIFSFDSYSIHICVTNNQILKYFILCMIVWESFENIIFFVHKIIMKLPFFKTFSTRIGKHFRTISTCTLWLNMYTLRFNCLKTAIFNMNFCSACHKILAWPNRVRFRVQDIGVPGTTWAPKNEVPLESWEQEASKIIGVFLKVAKPPKICLKTSSCV